MKHLTTTDRIDHDQVDRLFHYACNYSDEEWNKTFFKLKRFYNCGNFDVNKAIGYVSRNLMVNAAKDWVAASASTFAWNYLFPQPVRIMAAIRVVDKITDDFRSNS